MSPAFAVLAAATGCVDALVGMGKTDADAFVRLMTAAWDLREVSAMSKRGSQKALRSLGAVGEVKNNGKRLQYQSM